MKIFTYTVLNKKEKKRLEKIIKNHLMLIGKFLLSVRIMRIVVKTTLMLQKASLSRTYGFSYCTLEPLQDCLVCLQDDIFSLHSCYREFKK